MKTSIQVKICFLLQLQDFFSSSLLPPPSPSSPPPPFIVFIGIPHSIEFLPEETTRLSCGAQCVQRFDVAYSVLKHLSPTLLPLHGAPPSPPRRRTHPALLSPRPTGLVNTDNTFCFMLHERDLAAPCLFAFELGRGPFSPLTSSGSFVCVEPRKARRRSPPAVCSFRPVWFHSRKAALLL